MDLYCSKYLKYKNKYLKEKKQFGGELVEVIFEYKGKTLTGKVPIDFLCSISIELMNDPVVLSDGYSYEENHIREWLKTHNTSPITGLVLPKQTLIPNYRLKGAINDIKEDIYFKTIEKESLIYINEFNYSKDYDYIKKN